MALDAVSALIENGYMFVEEYLTVPAGKRSKRKAREY